jgi:flagellar FliL protein
MATAPKSTPKVVPIDESAAATPPKNAKKKLVIIAGALLLVVGGAGGAWYFMGSRNNADHGEAAAAPKHDPGKPPVFVNMEPFTVNLQPDAGVDQYLQVQFTLQVADDKQVEQIKLYMPLIRSRILLLLASKKASELTSADGKKKLQDEILAQVKQPFSQHGAPQDVSGVFFTSFVIQ